VENRQSSRSHDTDVPEASTAIPWPGSEALPLKMATGVMVPAGSSLLTKTSVSGGKPFAGVTTARFSVMYVLPFASVVMVDTSQGNASQI
jgi:hypothetical protein